MASPFEVEIKNVQFGPNFIRLPRKQLASNLSWIQKMAQNKSRTFRFYFCAVYIAHV